MDTVGEQEIWSLFDEMTEPRVARNSDIRNGPGHLVGNYLDLAKKIAALQHKNRDYVLLFRGQCEDWRNRQQNSSLKPELFRPEPGSTNNPGRQTLVERFDRLKRAEQLLVERYRHDGLPGAAQLQRHRILRWSILQHYKICATPLLDVTHSLRIAASFAYEGRSNRAFLFVLAVPNLSGAITASAEAGLQIVRLASVCPAAAVRPHIQEGYLLGEYPEMPDFDQKQFYAAHEIDFGRRLVAKFSFDPRTFWKADAFPRVGRRALYPDADDPLCSLAESVQAKLSQHP